RSTEVRLVERIVRKEKIECDFKRVPWYLFSETNEKDETIENEIEAADGYGLQVEELNDLPLPIHVSKAIKVDNQAQFNPSAFVTSLAEKVDNTNCRIFENSPVYHIEK